MSLNLFLVILVGVLATACPGVLERVELRRLAWGGELAGPGVVKLAVERCDLLGRRGVLVVDGVAHEAYVVDCQQAAHRAAFPMSGRGLVADVDGGHPELNGKRAVVMLRSLWTALP